jgi:uncharacterized membrane protein
VPRHAGRADRPARRRWVPVAGAGAVAIALVAPYASLDVADSRIPTSGPVHYGLLVVHVLTAAVALVLGPVQFLTSLDRRVHRVTGRCYLLLGVLPAALAGIPVAILSGRPLTQVGLTLPCLGWLATAALAIRAIRRGDPGAHREWMMRNYALTLLAVTARVLVPVMLLATLPVMGATGLAARAVTLIPVGQVLAWIVDLAVVEALIRRLRAWPGASAGRPRSRREPASRG